MTGGETSSARERAASFLRLSFGMGNSVPHLEELRKMDRAHHLHPFTDHAAMHPSGTHILTGGKGVYLQGEEGTLLDGLAGCGA